MCRPHLTSLPAPFPPPPLLAVWATQSSLAWALPLLCLMSFSSLSTMCCTQQRAQSVCHPAALRSRACSTLLEQRRRRAAELPETTSFLHTHTHTHTQHTPLQSTLHTRLPALASVRVPSSAHPVRPSLASAPACSHSTAGHCRGSSSCAEAGRSDEASMPLDQQGAAAPCCPS